MEGVTAHRSSYPDLQFIRRYKKGGSNEKGG